MATKKKTPLFEFPHPRDNDTLVGHMNTVKTFMNAWTLREKHPIHPVWILTGSRGIGKATLAYKLAKNVYGDVGDFFVIDKDNNIDEHGNYKADSKWISVHTVRNMIERMQLSSMSGAWRVVLIDSLDELNTSASNAILKLLEEPPEKTLFLLIAHQLSNVLPTIRSRARVEKMRPLSISELRDLCTRFIPNEYISSDLLKLVNGSFGKIADMKRCGGDTIYNELIDILSRKNTSGTDLMAIAKKIAPNPELYSILFDVIAHFGIADLYPIAISTIANISKLNLEPETSIFKILVEIKECL